MEAPTLRTSVTVISGIYSLIYYV